MLIKIRSPFLLFLFGWGRFPSEVVADHKLWWRWLWKDRHGKRTEDSPTTDTSISERANDRAVWGD